MLVSVCYNDYEFLILISCWIGIICFVVMVYVVLYVIRFCFWMVGLSFLLSVYFLISFNIFYVFVVGKSLDRVFGEGDFVGDRVSYFVYLFDIGRVL